MKRILLATAATLALSLPAVAAPANAPANNTSSQQMNQTAPSHMNNAKMNKTQSQMNSKAGTNQQAQTKEQQRINPKRLSKQEVKSIQQALNKKGFSAGHVDGIWGRDTDVAIRNFQKKQGLPGNGHLNRQTLAALGVNMSQGSSGTVGSGSSSMNSRSTHMNRSTNGMNQTAPTSANHNQMKPSNPSNAK